MCVCLCVDAATELFMDEISQVAKEIIARDGELCAQALSVLYH